MALTLHTPECGVALETTLLLHGVPKGEGEPLARELEAIVRAQGATPLCVGIVSGKPIVGLSNEQLRTLLNAPKVPKANTANLGVLMHRGQHAATTVSTTMELAAAAGVKLFATGGLGGVHEGYGTHLDISADLAAFTRFPVGVVTSGVKSILDVVATREALETLGITVVGFRTDRFPAFYLRESAAGVDARFDDEDSLAAFLKSELARTGRGIVIANPIPVEHELSRADWDSWLSQARKAAEASAAAGRDVTPALLGHLHAISGGRTLKANLELVKSNARLAGALAARMRS
ncbi:MAG: pseudouridine-5'-phosphate glycosidase [Planctomycetota bacterium]|nr:pseudouridine-5'-phosphate glycosidase [Planctomycetota bacterium]